MRLLRTNKDHLVFHVGGKEKQLLLALLRRYPLVPDTHFRLSRATPPAAMAEDQRLLEEALTAHREENRRQVLAWLNEPERFEADATGFRFKLSPAQVEWLLQVLNDIRVGSWIALGSPEMETEERIPINAQTAPLLWTMEMAGHFQAGLLAATGSD